MNIETPRKLTIEERRKLEKLIEGDIDVATSGYSSRRGKERDELEKALEANPPAQVAKLYKEWLAADKARQEAEDALDALGYDPDTDELEVNYRYSKQPKALEEFDAQTRKGNDELKELKRTYTIKLFAGGAEVENLFKALADDLATLTK